MQQRLPSALPRPILFAHRGARAHAPENTLDAFSLGLRLGATGIESDVWLTGDGVPVLDHDGVVGRRLRRRAIATMTRAELPDHIPSLVDLIGAAGLDYELSLDLKDVAAADPVIDVVREASPTALRRLWLCHGDVAVLAGLRSRHDTVRLVHSSRLSRLPGTPERHAAVLREASIDTMNMHRKDWNGGLVTLFHRFDVLAFGWDLQFEHELRPAIRMGLDGVYSDHVDRMHQIAREELGY